MEDTRSRRQYEKDTIEALDILEYHLTKRKICKHCDNKYFPDDEDVSKYCPNCLYLWRNNLVERL